MNSEIESAVGSNPFFEDWDTPFGAPPFRRISPEHFRPAFERALAEQRREIARIADDADAASFANTVEALERSGQALRRVSAVFFNLVGTDANEALEGIEREISPVLARHRNGILTNQALFARLDELRARRRDLGLSPEQARVLERYHVLFRRAGAALDASARQRLAEIAERLAELGTRFGQNVLTDEKAFVMALDEADLAGLPDFVRTAAARTAEERGLAGHAVTLARSSIEPFLQFSMRRDLREKAYRAWISRGEGGTDNKPIVAEMVRLRAERARLLGYPSFADFRLDDSMAKSPKAVRGLLDRVWGPARARAESERAALQGLIHAEGGNFELAPWDWRHYAEKLRKRDHDLDEADVKPYLQLDRMIEAAFFTAERLFGLHFEERRDVPVYHPDVRVWEVTGAGGRLVGLFYGDYFARASKRSGAWMSVFRGQEKLSGDVRPIVVNACNFQKGGANEPALLSFDDARTLFHEFGHALHGLLSDVTYPLISGTGVLRDFVEFPSQLFEHWLEQPELLRRFAVHARSGEPMPEALLARVLAARNVNQGFATVEYLASAYVDLDFHLLSPEAAAELDVAGFEAAALARIGMPREIPMRHRTPHFGHVFAGDGYSAGYYSYLWSEVLDADGFGAFEEAGDIFDASAARRLRDFVYAAGGRFDPAEAYERFRGRAPRPDALLEKRGFAPAEAA